MTRSVLNEGKLKSAHSRRAQAVNAQGTFEKRHVQGRWLRQGGCCHYCKARLELSGPNKCQLEHFVPLSRGGSNWPTNLVLACPDCNRKKGSKMPWEFMPERFGVGCQRDR